MAHTQFFKKKTIKDIDIHGKTILLRADFNVPMNDKSEITSEHRIIKSLPTIKYLLDRKCKVIIISHIGRPDGKPEQKYSLRPAYTKLQELMPEIDIKFSESTIDDSAKITCKQAVEGEIVLLENLRFDPGEVGNDMDFAKQLRLVSGADYFVQDGFGVVHRAHASTEAITHLLPALGGLLLAEEVDELLGVMSLPRRPLVAVVGGAKISDKIGFIERLLEVADTVLIGGAMANTFLKYNDNEIGKSVFEPGQEEIIKKIFKKAKPGQLILPKDVGVAAEIATSSQRRDCAINEIQKDEIILDIGFETMREFSGYIHNANTVIWNGPLGYAEIKQFA
ncbi:phosphoglycerate kinase, partial [Candidatus Saccharibacteria bacterium]|nr:phosphoglycerate kinase [Candidatus Saccharibacteria bacterium]